MFHLCIESTQFHHYELNAILSWIMAKLAMPPHTIMGSQNINIGWDLCAGGFDEHGCIAINVVCTFCAMKCMYALQIYFRIRTLHVPETARNGSAAGRCYQHRSCSGSGLTHLWHENWAESSIDSNVLPLQNESFHDQNFPSLVAPEVVVMTTLDATNDDKIGIMATPGFQWYDVDSIMMQYTHMMTSSDGNIFRVTGFCEAVDSPHKGQWCGALMVSLICAWTSRLGKRLSKTLVIWDAIVLIMTSL